MGTLVQAAWALVLSRTTGRDDVVFGATRACRRSSLGGDAEKMVGLFINSIPVRAWVGDELTVAELLGRLRDQSVLMREHEHTPLVDIHGVSEVPQGVPLFETLVMFENRNLNRTLRVADPRWADRTVTLHEQPSLPLCVRVFDDQGFGIRPCSSIEAAIEISRPANRRLLRHCARGARPRRTPQDGRDRRPSSRRASEGPLRLERYDAPLRARAHPRAL